MTDTLLFSPTSRRGGANHRWGRGLAPEILAYVTALQTGSVGSRCDAIFAVAVIGIMASPAISQSVRADPRSAETPLVRMAYIRSGSCNRRVRLYPLRLLIRLGSPNYPSVSDPPFNYVVFRAQRSPSGRGRPRSEQGKSLSLLLIFNLLLTYMFPVSLTLLEGHVDF